MLCICPLARLAGKKDGRQRAEVQLGIRKSKKRLPLSRPHTAYQEFSRSEEIVAVFPLYLLLLLLSAAFLLLVGRLTNGINWGASSQPTQ